LSVVLKMERRAACPALRFVHRVCNALQGVGHLWAAKAGAAGTPRRLGQRSGTTPFWRVYEPGAAFLAAYLGDVDLPDLSALLSV
jgi:hypothetical protein